MSDADNETTGARHRVRRSQRRGPVVGVILVMLILAGVANATIKHDRIVARSAPSAALTTVDRHGSASSVAWYCAGPLPLGLKSEHALLVLANVTASTVRGGYSVATESGVIASHSIVVGARTSVQLALPSPSRPAYSSATVLVDGGGLAVSEEIQGPAGTDVSPCVAHATATQYVASGATTRPNAVALSLYDPGATPSVASITFATPTGVVAPPAYQGLPIAAGATLILDVGRFLPSQALLGITVNSTGGPIVVGSLESALTGKILVPTLVVAAAVAERAWWFAPAPAGPNVRQRFSVLNPSSTAASVRIEIAGTGGSATESMTVPAGGLTVVAPAPDEFAGSLRWASVTASAPVVVTRATTLLGATPISGAKASIGAVKVIAGLPAGYTVSPATPALAKSWLVGAGESNRDEGELIFVANPSSSAAAITFVSLSGGAAPAPVTVGSGGSRVVSVPTNSRGTVLIVTGSVPVVVASATYARGPSSIGWSSPGAIVVN